MVNIEKIYQLLAKLLSENENYEVNFKIERKEGEQNGISLCEKQQQRM